MTKQEAILKADLLTDMMALTIEYQTLTIELTDELHRKENQLRKLEQYLKASPMYKQKIPTINTESNID